MVSGSPVTNDPITGMKSPISPSTCTANSLAPSYTMQATIPAIRPRPTIMSIRCGANAISVASTATSVMVTRVTVLCATRPNTSAEIARIGIAASNSTKPSRAYSHLVGGLTSALLRSR